MRYDVIVVGAGPAGSTTARECAERGLSVLMLDKAEFPRDKPCGGGVTVRAAELLPFDITPVVERVITGIHLTLRQSTGFTRFSSKELVYLTQRSRLDAFLVERALDAGVTLRQRAAVREIERGPSQVTVRTNGETFDGTTLVAADGANGQTARLAGIDVRVRHQVAMEGNITPADGVPEMWQEVAGLDIGGIPGGYAWVFPKGDHLNFGLGGWRYVGPTLRERMDRFVRFYGFDPADLWGLRGYHLPLRHSGSPVADGNVLLVGDAAGLIDAITDEGIYSAFWSGRVASRHLAAYAAGEARDLSAYQVEVDRDLAPDLGVSRQFQDLFDLSPALFMAIERRTSILWRLTCRILRGEQTYVGVMQKHRVLATAIDFISDLVRVAPPLRRLAGLPDPTPPERFFRRRAGHTTSAP